MANRAGHRTVSLAIPAKADYVVLARLALSAVCRLTPLPPEDVADLKLAISEAASGLIADEALSGGGVGGRTPSEGAGPGSPADETASDLGGASPDLAGRLSFCFELLGGQLVVDIDGAGQADSPTEEQELGRAIIAATVDDCEYDEGHVRLIKYLDRAK